MPTSKVTNTPVKLRICNIRYHLLSTQLFSHTLADSMSESLAAFRTGRSKDLAKLAESHIEHE